MTSSNDFVEWKRHPVTKDIFRAWKSRHDELIDILVEQSYFADPRKLAETAAAIKVYREILEMTAGEADGY